MSKKLSKMIRNKRKANKGFTLSEVLIIVGIIGIIAAFTIPALFQDSDNKEFAAGLKKVYADLSQATEQIMQDNNGNLAGAFGTSNIMMNTFCNKMNCVKKCNVAQNPGTCFYSGLTSWKTLHGDDGWADYTDGGTAILSNGALVSFVVYHTACDANEVVLNGENVLCGWVNVDINGFKGPNVMGRDIFMFHTLKNGLYPQGIKGDIYEDVDYYCNPAVNDMFSGCSCATRVLEDDAINY